MPGKVTWSAADQVGEAVPLDDQPPWLREYRHFLSVNQLLDGRGEWLLRCRFCELGLGIDPKVAGRLPVDRGLAEVIMGLAAHGLGHAFNGDLPAVE